MSLTQEPPVTGHNGHDLTNLVPFRPVPIRSSLEQAVPDTAEQTQPLPPLAGPDTGHTEQGEQRPVTSTPPAAPTPAPAAPSAKDTAPVDVETEMRRDGHTKPQGPRTSQELDVSFPLRGAIKVGFAMTVAAAAIGQTLFFASFFGGGVAGYGLALLVAAFAEVTMIGSGDGALRHKVEGNAGWHLLLAVSALVALGATTLQVAHWTAQDEPVMALTFGAASLLGWLVHIVSGLITANGYLARRVAWDAELDRRRRKREDRADAEYERALAEVETQRQAVQRAVDTVTPTDPAPPAKSKSGNKKTTPAKSAGRTAAAAPELTPAVAREWSDAHDGATASQVIAHFKQQGYQVKEPRTVRRWLNDR